MTARAPAERPAPGATSRALVVMPALNAEATLEKTVADIPPGTADEILLVDDASTDRTVEIATRLGLTVIRHDRTRGYGANQKTCYREALARGADIVLMIHPDYQYDSRLAPHFVRFIRDGYFDVMLGSRIRTRAEALACGMPVYKYVANRFLTIVENLMMGTNLSECHTGYRAYHRRVLETVPWENNSDDFLFDTQLLMQSVYFGFQIAELPVPVRYGPDASSTSFSAGVRYGLGTLVEACRFVLNRMGVMNSSNFRRTDLPDAT